ncbi:hypothetical protein GGI25_000594 [Coemansia spiralis]|uniref:FAD dependent oxidoreductase domain-containing protein n=2 Tax=Coemansia TaxID=4863 RepID=A0A9W8GE38_9FUNG|nr:FAD dependent oxidoreductase [Coemansia spiralis]KAJ1996055.1 hypothetical protein EDC05_000423 [Coemansia umbellata]KAJ2625496.1 hypothetical protein GGI26_000636 [Coemansia sp. RSA 1358]KAJ2680621.1 hypothetical protein GGI25_000594 [Coemansia spiralis]
MAKQSAVVVGAGVIGLTVANQLQDSNLYNVTIVAECSPADAISSGARQSTKWASPWAGAHWRAWASNDNAPLQKMEIDTYHEMMALAENCPKSGIKKAPGMDLFEANSDSPIWYASMVSDASEMTAIPLPDGVAHGLEYTTLIINVPVYLQYLLDRFVSSGGELVKQHISHINDALAYIPENEGLNQIPIVVNCTGLGSLELGGVEDKNMYPIRGQTILIDAPDAKRTITRIGKLFSYVIPRGDGTVIIGGTAEKGDWNELPDNVATETILHRALDLEPALLPQHMSNLPAEAKVEALRNAVISVNVGFRPMREGGVRLDWKLVNSSAGKFKLVHCYGHGGFGYQSSFAYAKAVLELANMQLA